MTPLLAQFEFNINDMVTAFGVFGTSVILVLLIAFLIGRAIANRMVKEANATAANRKADTEQQNSFTKIAMDNAAQIIKLHETIKELHIKIIEIVELRTADREELAVLRTKSEHESIQFGLLKDQINRMEKQYAKMQSDLNLSNADREKLRTERDKLREEMGELRVKYARLEAESKAYKQQVQIAKTQPIPPLAVIESAIDPNTPTPDEAAALIKALDKDAPVDKTADNNTDDENNLEDLIA